ncbi:hypothetical protein C4J85_3256 [Pseudomonas sp. R4-34-07]|uniref:DUF6338 family protein n=1 Tax=Pseudomonas sp. R4-34-07 TaxID=658642 RepID=UPI000F577579|nr:DUF6338 family protein [Pseudomonas sp. R4-34-07]AZF53739.1 hypothetical protein C4J85_3256 [Pseudomonas sp. R4-34-07]
MDDLVKEVIPLLQYLIPGFLTAWIFYSLTAFRRPDTFGQIVQALIFTFVIHGAVILIKAGLFWFGEKWWTFGDWGLKAEASWSFIVSVTLGLLACYFANNDKLHVWLRDKHITKQTSYPTEWFSAFAKHKRFVVLHLIDERRLYGWPLEWPSEPKHGQFVIQAPSWLDDQGKEFPLAAELLVVDASNVLWVEFTPKTW